MRSIDKNNSVQRRFQNVRPLRLEILVPLLLFWAMALWRLGDPSFWYDELFNADLVMGHSVARSLWVLRTQQPYPPLYHALLKLWSVLLRVRSFRPGLEPSTGLEFLLRFPSVVAGLLALSVVTPLARKLRLRGGSLLLFALALHPTLLWYARDARLYTLWILWLLLALYGLIAERGALWIVGGACALLTHYFSLFPLAGAALAAFLVTRRRWRTLPYFAAPFVPALLWGLYAFQVTMGFESFGTAASPSFSRFLHELGPELLTAHKFLLPPDAAPSPSWGYASLAAGALGLLLLTIGDVRRGGVMGSAWFVGAAATFAFWQLRPVDHVRYLVWALPLLGLGLTALVALPLTWLGRAHVARVVLTLLVAPALLWNAARTTEIVRADRTLWHPDFRFAVGMLNRLAKPEDRCIVAAAHVMHAFTSYQTTVPFIQGPYIGDRLQPETAAQLLTAGSGRRWLLLYQDDAVDPGEVLIATLEQAGGRRTEILYSRELRLFAYELPTDAQVSPLKPEIPLDAHFTGGLTLRGASVHAPDQGLLPVTLFWKVERPQSQSLIGAVHLVRQAGEQPLTQHDEPLLSPFWRLPSLPTGEVLPNRYALPLPVDLPPGTYKLFALLYDPATGERHTLPSGADMVSLGTVTLP
ncbi:MAG: hypothetical protein ACP5HM_10415 [Anaerolineae bacterium]